MFDKPAHHVVGVIAVADRIGSAEKHLQQNVGHAFTDRTQSFPWIFAQKTHGDIEGRASPHFQTE